MHWPIVQHRTIKQYALKWCFSGGADENAEKPVKPNVFDVLLNAQKSYTNLPDERYILAYK